MNGLLILVGPKEDGSIMSMQAGQPNGPVLLASFITLMSQLLISSLKVAMIWPGYGSVVKHLTGMCESLGSIPGSTKKNVQNQ